jgi:hypothetical protein
MGKNKVMLAVILAVGLVLTEPGAGAESDAKALAREVRRLPMRSFAADGLVGRWSGNGDSKDSLGRHHGTVKQNVTYTSDRHGQANSAFAFSGKGGLITVPDHNELDTDDAFTLSVWVKPNKLVDRNGRYAQILSKWNYSANGNGDYILYITVNGCPSLYVGHREKTHTEDSLRVPSSIPTGAWTHLAATFDRGKISIYVNGKLGATKTLATIKHTSRREYEHDYIAIGAKWDGKYSLDGAMDEVAIWRRALGAKEILAVARARSLANLLPMPAPQVTRKTTSDLIRIKDGSVITGAVVNDAYLLSTAFGKVKMPARRVVGFTADRTKAGQVRFLLTDGQVISGTLRDQTVQIKLSRPAPLKVPPGDIVQCGYRITRDKPAVPKVSGPTVSLLSGDRFIWTGGLDKLVLKTPYAAIGLPAKSIVELVSTGRDAKHLIHRVRLTNGSTISGTLAADKVTLKLQLGPKITVNAANLLRISREGKIAAPVAAATVKMRNGDRLLAKLVDGAFTIKTDLGEAKIKPSDVRTTTFDLKKPGQVVATMSDGTTLRGRLIEQTLTFAITGGGPIVKVTAVQIASISWLP